MTAAILAVLFLMAPVAQSAQEAVYEAGPGITLPKVVKEVKPDYPKEAMDSGAQGAVLMKCVVGRDGRPSGIEITRSLEPRIDEAAVAALRQWEFTPGTKDGEAVPVRITIEMRFALK